MDMKKVFRYRLLMHMSAKRPQVLVLASIALMALYELIEWAAAIALGQGADEFLGTQGDPWDTQSDMLLR